jgi:alkylhydroperoxidase/carboxymuconolactone decarboxylase family protein YurZ
MSDVGLEGCLSSRDSSRNSCSCDDCIAFHIKAALQCGATREEISETLGMAIYMGAGPSVMYASHAFAALQQFDAQKENESA